MTTTRSQIVVVGSGNIAQYVVEEFLADQTYDIHVISRTKREFFDKPEITFHHITEYSKSKLLSILDAVQASAIISTLQSPDPTFYNAVHESILIACRESKTCKRLVSSEYMGNLRDLPNLPRGNYYARQPFRLTLKNQSEVKWTLVCQGWLADYFIQPADGSKSYMRPFPQGWPIDLDRKTVRIIGTGDEPVAWTATRDMAKAVVQLMSHDEWPDHTYVFGELSTWNVAVEKLETFLGRKLERIHRTPEDMREALMQAEDKERWYQATMDEWSYLGGTAVPMQEALEQRKKYFSNMHFRTVNEVLADSLKVDIL